MNLFLTLAFLFFIGSVCGWVIELLFRRFFHLLTESVNGSTPAFAPVLICPFMAADFVCYI